jgi:phenylalanyl-tRNA synthetase beta chain
MKISYKHLVSCIEERPSIESISNSLFQLGHEHEIEGDIFNMEFTPNRGDCLSVNGLLRDLAVFYKIDCNQELYNGDIADLSLNFENLSEDKCTHISFLKLEIDSIPNHYSSCLESYFLDLSINKNNFFTDISNYLSYETGQPTHCYDEEKIRGKLLFHEINENLEFETLLDKKISLTNSNAVFSLNNEVINLAGVVGGKSSACSKNTKKVIVECAYFQPEAIIGKSIKYDIQSEASHKFERGVDPKCQEKVLRRFIKLVSEHTNIRDISMASYKYNDDEDHKIPINLNKINQIIGMNITYDCYLEILTKLGFRVENDYINVPSFRSDVRSQNDLAEEVARVIGYDNVQISEINIPKNNKSNSKDIENKLRFFLLDHGFYEVINSPFVNVASKDAIKVDNPLDSNRGYLRTNITNSLVDNLLFNERRQKDSIKLFEISNIYSTNKDIDKKRRLSIIASGRVGLNYEDFSKRIDKKYLTKILNKIAPDINFDIEVISRNTLDTKIKNEIFSLEIEIDEFKNDIYLYEEISKPPQHFNQVTKISEHPTSFKDISFLIKDPDKINELQELLLGYSSDIINKVFIFDYYNNLKKNEIKMGFRFIFQSKTSTLTSSEIDFIYHEIINKSLKIRGVSIPGLR